MSCSRAPSSPFAHAHDELKILELALQPSAPCEPRSPAGLPCACLPLSPGCSFAASSVDRESLTLKLRRKDSRVRPELQVHLQYLRKLVPIGCQPCAPRRRRSSAARVSSSSAVAEPRAASAPRAAPARDHGGTPADERLRTSCPDVPRTAASEETRHTTSRRAVLGGEPLEQRVRVRREAHLERADDRSSPTPSKTTTPRAPRIATKPASRSTSSSRSPNAARVEEVVAVEEVERRVRHRAPLPDGLEQEQRGGDAHVERLDAALRAGSRSRRRRRAARAAGSPCPRRRRRARRPPVRSASHTAVSAPPTAADTQSSAPLTSVR